MCWSCGCMSLYVILDQIISWMRQSSVWLSRHLYPSLTSIAKSLCPPFIHLSIHPGLGRQSIFISASGHPEAGAPLMDRQCRFRSSNQNLPCRQAEGDYIRGEFDWQRPGSQREKSQSGLQWQSGIKEPAVICDVTPPTPNTHTCLT